MTRTTARRAPGRRKGRTGAGPVVALLPLVGGSLAALVVIGFMLWPRWPDAKAVQAPTLPITVGGVVFNVPPDAIRVPTQRYAGAQARLDLAFLWPDLTPPDPAAKPGADAQPLPQIFINITGPRGALPLGERIKTIYPRYTARNAFEGPEGLVGVAFRDGTPYQGEDLFFQPERPEQFLVRCTRTVGITDGSCLLERHVGEAELTVRFPRAWLADWQQLAGGIERLIGSLQGAKAT